MHKSFRGAEMEYNAIFAKSFSRYEQRKLGYGAFIGCLLVCLSFVTMFRPSLDQLKPLLSLQLSMNPGLHMLMVKDTSVPRILEPDQRHLLRQPKNLTSNTSTSSQVKQERKQPRQINVLLPQQFHYHRDHSHHQQQQQQQRRSLNSTSISPRLEREIIKQHELVEQVCNLMEPRSDFCKMNGDIRIHGNSSTVLFASPQVDSAAARNATWKIKPYARKGDAAALGSVTEFLVRPFALESEAPRCNVNHRVPAIVFSAAGYSGNHFHALADILVPLFAASYRFRGEVKLLVSNSKSCWIAKYKAILENLSRYEIIINIDKDDRIHCFPSMIVGLKQHQELRIDPSQSGYSMKDFREFLRSAYSLKKAKAAAISIRNHQRHRKVPRLLIVTRKRTRSFTNEGEIVKLAKSLGYKVMTAEPALMNMTSFARVVNSCDVMMGVHGAGLANIVFLPSHAVLIQVVPLGGLKWLCSHYFGEPALEMDLKYLEYKIREEESTLMQQYPLDHPVFKDPTSIHKQGWEATKAVYLDKQDVKLDVNRFRATLLEALELLHH
ncbi:hypothetical protein Scep_022677 [Stephania cephalantha]|uniref:Glycosyltransferase 61 catalytic domain-containing protein n=1 Tax=Stephania cephalantha TaxID=152367 RepID=A0AAP0FGJ9_9MAGN